LALLRPGTSERPTGTGALHPGAEPPHTLGGVSRKRSPGWVPNQHGAWAMLVTPLLVGVLSGGPAWVHLPLALFWFLGYFAFFATGLWLKARRKARYRPPVVAYGIGAGVAGLVVLA